MPGTDRPVSRLTLRCSAVGRSRAGPGGAGGGRDPQRPQERGGAAGAGGPGQPGLSGAAVPHRLLRCASSSRVRLRLPCRPWTRCWSPGTRWSRSAPGRMRPAGGASGWRRAPLRSGRRPSAWRRSSRVRPRDEDFVPRLDRAGPRLLSGGGLRGAAAAAGTGHPAPRVGQPALLPAAGLARGGAGPARHHGRGPGHRRHHLPDRAGARRRADLRQRDRADPAHRHRRGPAGPAGGQRCGAAGAHPGRHRGRNPDPTPQPTDRSAMRPRSTWPTPRSAGPPRRRDRPADPGLRARPGRLDHLPGGALQDQLSAS